MSVFLQPGNLDFINLIILASWRTNERNKNYFSTYSHSYMFTSLHTEQRLDYYLIMVNQAIYSEMYFVFFYSLIDGLLLRRREGKKIMILL